MRGRWVRVRRSCPLGSIWDPLGFHLGPKALLFWVSKKGSQKSPLRSLFAPQNGPQNGQKMWKSDLKNDIEIKLCFLSIFVQFELLKWSPRTHVFIKKPFVLLYGSENSFFQLDAIFWSMLVQILALWGAILDAKWPQNRSRERLENHHVFKHVFWWILAYLWLPKGRFFHGGVPLLAPFFAPFAPLPLLRPPSWPFWAHLDHFETIWEPNWLILVVILGPFWTIWGR